MERLVKSFDAIANALRIASGKTERNPSDAAKEAGNYQKGKLAYKGLNIAIENPKGSERSGVGKDGKRWSVKMPAPYGYVLGTEGYDKDHVDVYLGPDHASDKVFVVDQVNAENKRFDEHKCMLSYPSKAAALADYEKAFSDGKAKDRIGAVTEMSMDAFKAWVKSKDTKKPLGDIRKGYATGGAVAMPLIKSGSKDAISKNISAERNAGKKPSQAVAIALDVARRAKRAFGGSVSPADDILRGYADGGAPDWRSDMDAPRPHYDPVTGEWIEPGPRRPAVLRAPAPGTDPTRTIGERALDSLLEYGPLPAKLATSIAMQPATAGLATGEALADPTIPKLTNAGVQTAMAAFRPMMALKALGLGYGAAGASDLGLLPFGNAHASDDGLTDAQRKRLVQLQKNGAGSRAERAELKSLMDMQATAARIAQEAKAQAALKGSILDKELEAKKKSDDQVEYNRAVSGAERARDAELARGTSKRFDQSAVGQVYDKMGILTPGLAALGIGALSRSATGGGTVPKDYLLPGLWGGLTGIMGANYPLMHDSLFAPAENPEKSAYQAYARELPPTHPRKDEWASYAKSLPDANPIKTEARKDLYDPVQLLERSGLGLAEGILGGVAGSKLMQLPGRTIDVVTGMPGRVKEGYHTGMAKADLAARDAASARRLVDQDREVSRGIAQGEAEALGRTSGLKALEDQSGAAARPGPSPTAASSANPTSVPPSSASTDMPMPPGVKMNARGLPYNAHTGHPLKKQLYTPRDDTARTSKGAKDTKKPADDDGKKAGGAVGSALDTARKYATGGAVLVGPVTGDTGGREDALPVKVPHKSYVLPADVVAYCGQNNTEAGQKWCAQQFGTKSRALGGGVDIAISPGEFVVSDEEVMRRGGGDWDRGAKFFDAFVKRARADHIKTLKSLPGPAKG